MEMGDGLTASAIFTDLALGKYLPDEDLVVRYNLLDYCKKDTLAMVIIHKRSIEMVL